MARWKLYAGIAIMLVAILSVLTIQHRNIKLLKAERDKYRSNTEVLMADVKQYQVRDSLSAAQVTALQLTVKEFERFRAQDAELIKSLQIKNRDLVGVNQAQSQTIIEMQSTPKDTVVIIDSVQVPAVAVHCGDAWYDFDGILTKDSFSGTLANRDSLMIAETVKYKRFLGFLWKTHKVKDRQMDAVSLNPHTKIMDVRYTVFEK